MTFNRFALLTTVSLLCFSTAPAAFAANDKLTSIIANNGETVDTQSLNQAMLDLMKSRDVTGTTAPQQTAGSDLPCPSNPGILEASPECLANIAPAAGDDGGDEAEETPDVEGDDSVNDEAPPADDPPTEEEPPAEEEPGCDGECGNEEIDPPAEETPEETPEECSECGEGNYDGNSPT